MKFANYSLNASSTGRRRDGPGAAVRGSGRRAANVSIRSLAVIATLAPAACGHGVLNPRGPIGAAEKTILIDSLAIMLSIVIPTIVAILAFA